MRRLLPLALALALLPCVSTGAGGTESSGFGAVAIPQPAKPSNAERCVEPVDIMRREHMVFLDHQRDRTVMDGERGGKYSLAACLDCHNPVQSVGETPRYGDNRHFCSNCHAYASVRIDCFECHADRGYGDAPRARLHGTAFAAHAPGALDAVTLKKRLEAFDGD